MSSEVAIEGPTALPVRDRLVTGKPVAGSTAAPVFRMNSEVSHYRPKNP